MNLITGGKIIKLLIIFGIIIVFIAGIIIYFYFTNINPSSEPWEDKGTTRFDLDGKLFLTLQPNSYASKKGIYSFNFADRQLRSFLTDNKYDNLTASFSDDNSKIVFISYRNGGIGQVFVADADGKNIKQITVSETIRKQLPVFSPNGKIIAFTVFPSDVKTFLPEDQKIYITDLDGNERFLTNGAHPMFLPGDKFVLVLKNDGLYMVSVENGVSSVVIKGGSAFTTMKLAFSKNRNMLVWTNFPNEVLIFKLSWDSSSGYLNHFLYKKILAGAFWAVFSPDGRYLAIQEAKNGNPPARARIVVYDLKTFEWEEIIDLGSYKQTAMWMTAWQSR